MPTCSYCKADVSPNAKECPKCGDNLKHLREAESDEKLEKMGGFVACGIGVAVLMSDIALIGAIVGILLVGLGIIVIVKNSNS